MLLSKAKDPAFWQTVRSDAAYQPMIIKDILIIFGKVTAKFFP